MSGLGVSGKGVQENVDLGFNYFMDQQTVDCSMNFNIWVLNTYDALWLAKPH